MILNDKKRPFILSIICIFSISSKIRNIKINPNQSKAINMLLVGKEKMINNSMYRVMTGTSQVTASRQLNDLVKKGVLKPLAEQKGRSAAYELNLSTM